MADCWLYNQDLVGDSRQDKCANPGDDDSDDDAIGDGEPDDRTFASRGQKKQAAIEENKANLESLIKTKHYNEFVENFENFVRDIEEEKVKVVPKKMYKLEIDPKKIDKVKKERTLMSLEEKFKYMLS